MTDSAPTSPPGDRSTATGAAAPTPSGVAAPSAAGGPAACCDSGPEPAPMMSDALRDDVLLRLRKINGQVQGVARMVEADRYCVDVLQQLSAVSAAVESVSKLVTRNYLERCVTDAINGGDPLIYDELIRVVFRKR